MSTIAQDINTLATFCGKRDVPMLTSSALQEKFGFPKADVMVLFGGSILAGGDVLADAIREGVARRYIIVGGAGHTTETLRQRVHREYPDIVTARLPEAEILQRYLTLVHHCQAGLLETQSTNCGNNITNLLALLQKEQIPCQSVILCQDATMQCRMDAGWRKYSGSLVINYAAYAVQVADAADGLRYDHVPHGMWEMPRYISLLLGEIPRLTDDANGYGPQGKGYIAHVVVPQTVTDAFERLKQVYGDSVREANPLYASK